MSNLSPKQLSYLGRCIQKNIELLDPEKDKKTVDELNLINSILNDSNFVLEFNLDEDIFKEVEENLAQLKELTAVYSRMVDLHILQEYDTIKKRITSLLEYLSTLKDLLNNEVMFNEDILKKEFKAQITKLISEEQGVSLTQAEKLVYSDDRYSSQFRRLRPYVDYAQVTKTKYDFYIRILQSITQSVSTASKEMQNTKMYGGVSSNTAPM